MSEGYTTKKVDGDLVVGRNVNAGGNATVQGNVSVGNDVVVKGWLKAKNIQGPCKGLFATEDRLKTCHPMPHEGWWALVGDTLPADIWRADNGEWKATGQKGGEPVADVDKFNVLSDTVDQAITKVNQDLSDLDAKTMKEVTDLDTKTAKEITDLSTKVSQITNREAEDIKTVNDSIDALDKKQSKAVSDLSDTVDKKLNASKVITIDEDSYGKLTEKPEGTLYMVYEND